MGGQVKLRVYRGSKGNVSSTKSVDKTKYQPKDKAFVPSRATIDLIDNITNQRKYLDYEH